MMLYLITALLMLTPEPGDSLEITDDWYYEISPSELYAEWSMLSEDTTYTANYVIEVDTLFIDAPVIIWNGVPCRLVPVENEYFR